MAAPNLWYPSAMKWLLDRALAAGTAKVMFLSDAYVLDRTNHNFVDDVSAFEVTGTGVSAGGLALTSPTTSSDDARGWLSATSVTGLNVTGCYGELYIDTGTPSTSPLLTLIDFSEGNGINVVITGETWNTQGIAALAV